MSDLILTEPTPKSKPKQYWTREQKSLWYKNYYLIHKQRLNAYRKVWRENNRERDNETARRYNAKWRKENPEKLARIKRNQYLKKAYGLTIDQYNAIFEKQLGLCAMCFKKISKTPRFHHADHDHKTGKFRAIICARCNAFIGHIEKNPELLKQAITYLEKYNG